MTGNYEDLPDSMQLVNPPMADLKAAMVQVSNGLSEQVMSDMRARLLDIDPNTVAVIALVEVPDVGIAMVGSTDLPNSTLFDILKVIANNAPAYQFQQPEGLPDV